MAQRQAVCVCVGGGGGGGGGEEENKQTNFYLTCLRPAASCVG